MNQSPANCLSMGGWLATSNNEYENSQIANSGGNTARKWIGASDLNVEVTKTNNASSGDRHLRYEVVGWQGRSSASSFTSSY
jgi:hypothetical protein